MHTTCKLKQTCYVSPANGKTFNLKYEFLDLTANWIFPGEKLWILEPWIIVFRTNKSEGTTLFLADVLSACYGKDTIDKIVFSDTTDDLRAGGAPRIDPKFVNNPELSDIQFRVEGRIFYAHKLGMAKIPNQ